MKILIAEHYEELCKLSAAIIKEQIQAKKDAVLGLKQQEAHRSACISS